MKEWIKVAIGGAITAFAIGASAKIGWKIGDELSYRIVKNLKKKDQIKEETGD